MVANDLGERVRTGLATAYRDATDPNVVAEALASTAVIGHAYSNGDLVCV